MLRVARKGIFIIEPRDHLIDRARFGFLIEFARRVLRRTAHRHDFEPVGNYIYSFSEREIEKFALGMGLRNIAFSGVNDAFVNGVENADPRAVRKVKASIKLFDQIASLGVRKESLIVAGIFKGDFPAKPHDWIFRTLPTNPYA